MEQQTKKCPYCGEEILAVAKKCKHCGEWLEEKEEKVAVAQSPIVEPVIEKPQETEAQPTSQEKTEENRNEYPPVESYYVSGKTKFIWGAISTILVVITICFLISPPKIEFDYLFGTIGYDKLFFILSAVSLFHFFPLFHEKRTSRIYLDSNGDLDIETPREYVQLHVSPIYVNFWKCFYRLLGSKPKILSYFRYQNGRVLVRNMKGEEIEGELKDLTYKYTLNKRSGGVGVVSFAITDAKGNEVTVGEPKHFFMEEEYADIEMILSLSGTVEETNASKFSRVIDSAKSAMNDFDFGNLVSTASDVIGKTAITNTTGLLARKRLVSYHQEKETPSVVKKVLIGITVIVAIFLVLINIANASSSESEYIEYYDEQGYSASDVENSEIDQFAEQPSDKEVTTTPRLLTVTKVDYSFYLKPQAGNTYEPSNMVDGNLATAWAISLDQVNYKNGKIYGPTFTIDCMKLSHVVIRNGYCKNESSYMNNTRALKVILCNAGNVDDEDETASYLYEGTLEDTSEEQVLHINSDLPCNQNIQKVQLIFPSDGLRRGNKWDDLCVTEIEFWGI